MHFEITASQQSVRKPMSTAQRNSSLFSEAPRIGATTLRRGQVLKYDETQMKQHEVMIKRLFDAGAIEIAQVDGDRRRDFRTEEETMKLSKEAPKEAPKKEEPKKAAPPPPPASAPKPPPSAPKAAPPPEPIPEPVKMEPAPEEIVAAPEKATEAPVSSTDSKGKKGRK